MFVFLAIIAGIVEEMGTVESLVEVDGGWKMTVKATEVLEDVKVSGHYAEKLLFCFCSSINSTFSTFPPVVV